MPLPPPKETFEDARVEDGEQAPPQAGEERRQSTASGGGEKLAHDSPSVDTRVRVLFAPEGR